MFVSSHGFVSVENSEGLTTLNLLLLPCMETVSVLMALKASIEYCVSPYEGEGS